VAISRALLDAIETLTRERDEARAEALRLEVERHDLEEELNMTNSVGLDAQRFVVEFDAAIAGAISRAVAYHDERPRYPLTPNDLKYLGQCQDALELLRAKLGKPKDPPP
jgi:hypothetical protein